jgi:hypothetical protein
MRIKRVSFAKGMSALFVCAAITGCSPVVTEDEVSYVPQYDCEAVRVSANVGIVGNPDALAYCGIDLP